MTEYMQFKARVYDITRRDEGSYNIHTYIKYGRRFVFYTFQTEKEIPKIILRIYGKTNREGKDYYPKVFIIPTPPMRMSKQLIRFDGNFALAVGYAKEIPPYVPLDKLIIASDITIYGENGKPQEMYIEGVCGLNTLNNNNLELRSYIINLRGANNLEDLLRFIRYNSRNNQSTRNGEMEKIGWYIIIGKDQNISCEQSNIAPTDIEVLEVYK